MASKKVFDYCDAFDRMYYPAGEPHIRLKENFIDGGMKNKWYQPYIIASAFNWNDLVSIKIGDQILKDNGVAATFVVPYMPFSRHDRKNDTLDSSPLLFVLDLMATIDLVTVDPHSDVSGIFPHYAQSEVVKLFETAGIFDNNALVAIPDAGATKKTYSWLGGRDVVQCLKTRDTQTGALSGFEVVHPEMAYDRNIVIIDDICDGGGTFIGLADRLLAAGAQSLRLGISHGLFTKGLSTLYSRFSMVYTLDTCKIAPETDGILHHVSTEELILEGKYF